MHRFYLPPEESAAQLIWLAGREAHHALHVLRLRSGAPVTVLDGRGQELACEVCELGRDKIGLTVHQRRSHPEPPTRITLLQAIPKGKLIESIIQKATELGASRVVPLLSERVATRIEDEGAGRKAEKWQRVAAEAIKQCGAFWLPQVLSPMTPKQFLDRNEPMEMPLLASLQPGSRHPRAVFDAFRAAHHWPPVSAGVWVGPEGDFSPEEIALIETSGAQPIGLGPLVLRTETAAAYSLSILGYELQDSRH
jgi:16S rRNA (uracil1498-N3)-methyltransferase